MALEDHISSIEFEWEQDRGFFWKIRQGIFDKAGFDRAHAKITAVPNANGEAFAARLVSLLWYIPIFMEWQRDRIKQNGGNIQEYNSSANALHAEVERILGVP
jgi:hypothetical protein